jgi:hypothetical protein
MKKQDFIDALYKCGWDSPRDAQHSNITDFWAKLFPACKELEEDLDDAMRQIDKLQKQIDCE